MEVGYELRNRPSEFSETDVLKRPEKEKNPTGVKQKPKAWKK